MPAITVRDVPEATRNELAARAARSGRSLQEFLRALLIDIAQHPDPAEIVAEIKERKRHLASGLSPSDILEHRDADRR